MKKLLLMAALCGAWFATTAVADDDARIWAYQYVLATSEHPREFATILEHLEDEPHLRKPELVDYLAEALYEIDGKKDRPSEELQLMLVQYLTKKSGPRYLSFFRELRKNRPLAVAPRAHVDRYVKKHEATKAAQYALGTVNLPALRAQFEADALAAQPTEDQALRMAKLPVNADFDSLISQIGRPQYIGSGQLRLGDRIFLDVHIQRMVFYYRGLGKVSFSFKKGVGWIARDREVDPEAFEDLMPYRAHAEVLGLPSDEAVAYAQLLSGHSMAVKYAAESRTRRGGATPQFMDAAAELLLANYRTVAEPRMVDSLAWICRLLQHSGGPRYGNVLTTVASGATSEKLQKFAKLKMEKSAPTTGEPYVPGSVSLAALRAQYPPLYPHRVYTSSGFHCQGCAAIVD